MTTMVTTWLTEVTCPTCAVPYAIPQELKDQALRKTSASNPKDFKTIHCPNGHAWHYTGKTEAMRLKEQLETAERQKRWADARAERLRAEAEAARRTAATYKGHATRQRKRAAAAVCPVEGCQRTIQQMARHLRTKHPEYVAEHAHG